MELQTLLDDLAAAPSPASTVDISRAMATGRRTVRRRRLVGAGSVAAAVVAVVGLVAAGLGTAPPAPPAPPAASASPSPTATELVAPTAFDPMVAYAEPGWLPPELTQVSVTTTRTVVMVRANRAGEAWVSVSVVTAGHEVNPGNGLAAAPLGSIRPGVATDPVHGKRAEWLVGSAGVTILRWEYAPTAWAQVELVGLTGDVRAIARQVAESVRFGVNTRVRLPASLVGLPSNLVPRLVTVARRVDGWTADVHIGPSDLPAGQGLPMSLWVGSPSVEAPAESRSTTVDGYPSLSIAKPSGWASLQVFEVRGMAVTLSATTALAASIPDGLVGLFRTLDLNPDPATWQ